MPKKAKRKRGKGGPKGKRVLSGLLEPMTIANLTAEFANAHSDGVDALERGDYDAFGKAILREREIIDAFNPKRTAAKRPK
jgi:hypothetical protein